MKLQRSEVGSPTPGIAKREVLAAVAQVRGEKEKNKGCLSDLNFDCRPSCTRDQKIIVDVLPEIGRPLLAAFLLCWKGQQLLQKVAIHGSVLRLKTTWVEPGQT